MYLFVPSLVASLQPINPVLPKSSRKRGGGGGGTKRKEKLAVLGGIRSVRSNATGRNEKRPLAERARHDTLAVSFILSWTVFLKATVRHGPPVADRTEGANIGSLTDGSPLRVGLHGHGGRRRGPWARPSLGGALGRETSRSFFGARGRRAPK